VGYHEAADERHLPYLRVPGDRSENLLPLAGFAPARKPIVNRLVRSVFAGAILPLTAAAQHMHDATQNPSVIMSLRATLIGRQMRDDLRPLVITEPKQVRLHRLASESVDQAFKSTHG
jgi:hypothetical protein